MQTEMRVCVEDRRFFRMIVMGQKSFKQEQERTAHGAVADVRPNEWEREGEKTML